MSAPQLVDTAAAATAVNVTTSTLRKWVSRKKLQGYGYDPRGRLLLDLGEVYQAAATARRRGSAALGGS